MSVSSSKYRRTSLSWKEILCPVFLLKYVSIQNILGDVKWKNDGQTVSSSDSQKEQYSISIFNLFNVLLACMYLVHYFIRNFFNLIIKTKFVLNYPNMLTFSFSIKWSPRSFTRLLPKFDTFSNKTKSFVWFPVKDPTHDLAINTIIIPGKFFYI